MKTLKKTLLFYSLFLSQSVFSASITIIDENTAGYYNNSIGTILDGTSQEFPVPDNDYPLNAKKAPNLIPAQAQLGDWLQNPTNLSSPWITTPIQIPTEWDVNTETAVIYPIDVPASGYSNVVMEFGVDNGIFVWLDGKYLGGSLNPGGVELGEQKFKIKQLSAGKHYLQVLREDHGGWTGYAVKITANAKDNEISSSIYDAKEISWQSVTGAKYQVQWTNISDTASQWKNFGKVVAGDGKEKSVFDSTRYSEPRSYRVLQLK